ncbi:17631_t:CDS:2, partial [Rhizophagus irregularis]
TLFRYLSYCKEKSVLEIQAIEHYNYLQFLKLLENIPEKKIQVGLLILEK